MPMITAAKTAMIPMVVYWRRMKATAPSKIVPATSCIASVPWSRDSTSRARYPANRIAMMPAIGMSHRSASAIRVCNASYAGLRDAVC